MDKTVRACPRCNSTDVILEDGNPLVHIAGIPPTWACQHCAYVGPMPVKELQEDRKSSV